LVPSSLFFLRTFDVAFFPLIRRNQKLLASPPFFNNYPAGKRSFAFIRPGIFYTDDRNNIKA